MTKLVEILASLVALAIMPIALVGTINRVKARWAGRRGAPIFQLAFDLVRLARKTPVYSTTTTSIFRLAPIVVLVTAVVSAIIVPLLGTPPIVSFSYDFVWFAYVWGLGRVALMLGALDTGSAFEGMGASREGTYATLLEPIVFLVVGALCLHGGVHSLGAALVPRLDGGPGIVTWAASIIALVIVVQVETSRMPIDDPSTHLELTMVHEVMILDHGAAELAMLQLGSAIKLFIGISLIANLIDPLAGVGGVATIVVHVALCFGLAIIIGLVESLVARIRVRVVPQYIIIGLAAAGVALLAMIGRGVAA